MVYGPAWNTSWNVSVRKNSPNECLYLQQGHFKMISNHFILQNRSEGEDWKRKRVAASKQVLPRNVNSYIEGLNPIYTRFSDHLRKIRSEDGLIEDFTPLSRKLTMEGLYESIVFMGSSKLTHYSGAHLYTHIHVLLMPYIYTLHTFSNWEVCV